jgi:hypothetical protein
VAELNLPEKGDNLFHRIIRNPHIESANPRERECTEMLCAVLRNTTELRRQLLCWMQEFIGFHDERIQDLAFIIETEGSIGSKRDDLRIEGWRETDEERQRVLLWTIEVKVGASFHESSPLEAMKDDEDEDVDLVNQIVNYDHWLDHQVAPNRAGFVLALEDMSHSLPPNLNCRWQCLSWSQLGMKVQDALRSSNLPEDEAFLAKHLLGFVVSHLWRVSEMTDFELSFDDIALMRAFDVVGRNSEDKINRLVESLIPIVEKFGIGEGAVCHQKSLYKGMKRSVVYRNLFTSGQTTPTSLMAGCTLTHMMIWLETAPGNANKATVTAIVQSLLPSIKERNSGWLGDQGWWDLQLAKPLESLLSIDDQAAEFEKFFVTALEDLREVNFFPALRDKLALDSSGQT